ncbi:MAG: anthranilate phosphoribosyltransferase [Bacteroidota bacterium]
MKNLKDTLARLFAFEKLNRDEAQHLMHELAENEYNEAQVSALLTVYQMRAISADELAGFRAGLLDLCLAVDLSDFDPMDLCGTGGDGKDTFNISTLSAVVTAACGVPVAKHGNTGVSSACGSSNVMEAMGYQFTNDLEQLKRQMEKANICFLHAPLFHPAMKNVAPIRRNLGFKTFFNMLGPLVNPAKVKKQSTGVFSLELARLYNYILQNEEGHQYNVIHSMDGYDEVSLTSEFKCFSHVGERLYSPEDLQQNRLLQSDLYGGDSVESSAKIFKHILKGEGSTAQNAAIATNAGLAISCATNKTLEDSMAMAHEALVSGKAEKTFKTLLEA